LSVQPRIKVENSSKHDANSSAPSIDFPIPHYIPTKPLSPEEIVITRNTSEANNLVSSGLDLGEGDEVVIFADNHPSNNAAWTEKARRFGYDVRVVNPVSPHRGPEYYLSAFSDHLTSRTRVLAITHVTNSVGDLFPVKELCAMARDRGVISLVDGAQSFGVLDVDLSDIRPDFYSGSAHKWPCGPKEVGVLFISRDAQARISPSVISLYRGATGISRRMEGMGQRDNPAITAFGEAIRFQMSIGMDAIEARARELAQALMAGLRTLDGIKLWTHPDPERSASVVTLQPGSLDPSRLAEALYTNDKIITASRGAADRPGLRRAPHCYNLQEELDRTIVAIARYLRDGV
jgi:selenocysteine lyase/cysteine desulfurase